MKRLYYARHGEGESNLGGIWASRSMAPLTQLGRQQAAAEGKKAKQQNLKIDLIVSSPITRAKQTAEIIAGQINYDLQEILFNDLFVERYYGQLEGQSYKESTSSLSHEDIDYVPGVETIAALHQRAEKAHQFLLNRPEENILVVAHSAFGRALRRVVLGQPHTDEYKFRTSLPHAEIVCWVES